MPLSRRRFVGLAAAGVCARTLAAQGAGRVRDGARIRAVAFDAFPILDPRPVFELAEQLFPGKGAALSSAWRARQFEYQWLRALSGQYADFWQVTEDSLAFAAELSGVELAADARRKLMDSYLELRAWPDVPQALRALRGAGLRLAVLSNATPAILESGLGHSGLTDAFESVISTDRIRTYKPDPRAYALAVDALGLQRDEILFVAFAGWDAAGAKAFGYRTLWINRMGLPAERLGADPDGTATNLDPLLELAKAAT